MAESLFTKTEFTKASKWLSRQSPWVSGSTWETVAADAASRGHDLSGEVLLDSADFAMKSLARAQARGENFSDAKRSVATDLDRFVDSRMRLVLHNNYFASMSAGRQRSFKRYPPKYLRFIAEVDGATTAVCRSRHMVVARADSPFWRWKPPLHHYCRSLFERVYKRDERNVILTPRDELDSMPPVESGWGLNAWNRRRRPNRARYSAALWNQYTAWTSGREYVSSRVEWEATWKRFAREELDV